MYLIKSLFGLKFLLGSQTHANSHFMFLQLDKIESAIPFLVFVIFVAAQKKVYNVFSVIETS